MTTILGDVCLTTFRGERPTREADFERILERISTAFSGSRWDRVSMHVDLALSEMLTFCCVDQVAIFELLPDRGDAYLRNVASSEDLVPPPDLLSYRDWFPWAFRHVVMGQRVLRILQLDELVPEAAADKVGFHALGLRSLLHIPLRVEGEVRFIMAVARSCPTTEWPDRLVRHVKVLGEILTHATARAEAAAAIAANEHDVRDALGTVHLGRWRWDVAADTLDLSDEAKHILGTDVHRHSEFMDFVAPADRAQFAASLEQARANPGVRYSVRFGIHTCGGETRTIQQWHEVMFPGRRTERLFATVQDVSALRDNEEEMTELRAHKWHSARVTQTALLVASLAHELSQPLAAILNNAQAGLRFLNNGLLSPEEMRDILTDIVASNRKAGDVMSALRAMLRRQHTTRGIFDGAEVVRDVLALVRSELMTEQIEVEASLAPHCLMNADKIQIEQVLLNLVMNSIDSMRGIRATARKLAITLTLSGDDHVELSVQDTGTGIPASKLDKVFEAFWTTKQKGLGMGLSVCRAIVESYGGRIWCESSAAGNVTFRLKLPLAADEVTGPSEAATARARSDGRARM